jgi:hypothetical protein
MVTNKSLQVHINYSLQYDSYNMASPTEQLFKGTSLR